MNGIVLTQEMKTSLTQALTQLLEQDTERQSARTKQREILEEFRPQIVAARAKNRSWAKIAVTLKAGGVVVSKTTLQRIFEPGTKSRSNATKKTRVGRTNNSTKKTRESRSIDTINAPEWYTEIEAPKPDVAKINAPEIQPVVVAEVAPVAVVVSAPPIPVTVARREPSAMFGSGIDW